MCVCVRMCLGLCGCVYIHEKPILTMGDGQNLFMLLANTVFFLAVFQLPFVFLLHARTFDLYGYGYIITSKKVNQSHYRPGVAQRFPGS